MVPSKGTGYPWSEKVLTEEVIMTGHPIAGLRSDVGPAILAVKNASTKSLKSKGVQVRKEESPLGGLNRDGFAEGACAR